MVVFPCHCRYHWGLCCYCCWDPVGGRWTFRHCDREKLLAIKKLLSILSLIRMPSRAPNSPCVCFFCLALEFWNHTWVTLLLSPVSWAILSRSCPSGLLSIWKFACRMWSCSSVNVVRTRFDLFLLNPSVLQPSECPRCVKRVVQFEIIKKLNKIVQA